MMVKRDSKKLINRIWCILLSVFLVIVATSINAETIDENANLLSKSQQILVVTSKDWQSNKGELQRFERKDIQSPWQAAGVGIPVVLGNAGLGWSTASPLINLEGPKKQEGDKRTPAGAFTLGQAFGFAHVGNANSKLLYIPITASTVCVNDPASKFYNKIIDTEKILQPDWKSVEQMRDFAIYEQGIVVRYNNRKPLAGAGSCIFLHNWQDPNLGTNGCVALSSGNLGELITWLDANKKPVIIILPKGAYQNLAKSWNLPELG